MKFTDEQGKQWEFRGEYRKVNDQDYFFSDGRNARGQLGGIMIPPRGHGGCGVRAIVHPAPVVHEFGGVKFEETGEFRIIEVGEWRLVAGQIFPCHCKTMREYIVLRPCYGD